MYALLVTDIAVNAVKHGYIRLFCRHVKSAHCHYREKTDEFERNGFSARIRTGYKQHFVLFFELQGHGNDFVPVDKRVSTASNANIALIVERRSNRLILPCKLRFCKYHIEIDDILIRPRYIVRASHNRRREIAQNTLDFKLLVDEFHFEFVVEFHNLHRLYKKRRSRSGLIVYQPRDRAFEVAFERNDVSIPAHRNDTVLQIFGILR